MSDVGHLPAITIATERVWGIRSKIIRSVAVIGAASNMPMIPHVTPQKISASKITIGCSPRCFPISRYYRAFDFTISAAGYNSFNEIIGFGVPSLLAPNLNRAMDDQSARAAFADLHGAAVHLDHDMLPILDQVLGAMMDKERRQAMKEKCQLIAKPNGAERAAQIVVDTITQVETP